MARLTISVLYTKSWRGIASVVLPVLDEYCHRWKHNLHSVEYDEPCPSDFGFRKLEVAREIFASKFTDFVWSLDLDTIITNFNINVRDFLDDYHDLYICKDANGINGGSFILRNSSWSDYFIEYCLDLKGHQGIHCEQDAIKYYRDKTEDPQIKILPHPSINSYDYSLYQEFLNVRTREEGHFHEGDFLLHLPGLGVEKRLEILKNTPIIK